MAIRRTAAEALVPVSALSQGCALSVMLGRYVVERLRDLGARSIEQTYDAQAAAALAEMPPERH